jgi:hypothetical protein
MKSFLTHLGLAGWLGLTCAACNPAPPASTLTPAPVTASSAPAEPFSPAQQTEAASATPTPWPTLTPIPDTWSTFSSADWPVTFRYPDGWRAESASRYRGPDGFFELAWRPHTASTFDSQTTLCTLEANRGRPADYGAYPFVGNWWGENIPSGGCAIFPSEDQPAETVGQAVLFLRLPTALKSETMLVLRADKQHLGALASTLRFAGHSEGTATPSSGVYDSPACHLPFQAPATAPDSVSSPLTLTEYAIASIDCQPYNQFDGFQAATPREAMAALHMWQEAGRISDLVEANTALAPLGYRLQATNPPYRHYDLYQGETAAITDVTHFGSVTVNRAGDDFALWLNDSDRGERAAMFVRRASVETHAWTETFSQPFDTAYVGNDLVALAYDQTRTTSDRPPSQINVMRNGAVIYTLAIPPFTPGGGPVRGLTAWGDHWVLEADNVVVIDGEILNDKLGYDEVFNWQLLGGKPFYFFRQGQSVGLSYDGQTLPYRYADVIHGFLCCDPAVYNIQSSSTGVWFYAQRDGGWFLVEIFGKS